VCAILRWKVDPSELPYSAPFSFHLSGAALHSPLVAVDAILDCWAHGHSAVEIQDAAIIQMLRPSARAATRPSRSPAPKRGCRVRPFNLCVWSLPTSARVSLPDDRRRAGLQRV
jgi:hypothetical protein